MHIARAAPLLLFAAFLGAHPEELTAQSVDSTLVRAQRMVSSGDGAGGRAVIDSLLAATAPGSPQFAEVLFWRASLASTAVDAERDYLRISIEYPLSPRAEIALLRLAQLELARGDRPSALRHLQRLTRDYPPDSTVARAQFWTARLLFEDGDVTGACAALSRARAQLPASDVELANQVEYYGSRCAAAAAVSAAPGAQVPDTAARRAGADSARAERPTERSSTGAGAFSVQVAAYRQRADADVLARRLVARGFQARVVGAAAPYRVRVGRYATRAQATEAAAHMRRANVNGIVVAAEPR